MTEPQHKIPLKNQNTYVYIDVSNIRSACLKTLELKVDFVKLLKYFQNKYINLREVRYYEGIANDDEKKRKTFNFLKRKGYVICPLERKSYNSVETEEMAVKCPKCSHKWSSRITRERKVLKSNVDVYLASDMLVQASVAKQPTRLILVSCDGDYAEAIRNMINLNENISVAVLATPYTRDIHKNTCSVRLRKLCSELDMSRFMVQDIRNIRTWIEDTK